MAYKKGIETKQTIIKESKKLFYIYGYKMVNISEICRNSNCKLGTFTYYFPKKEDLVTEIYESYLSNCYSYVESHLSSPSKLITHIYAICFYYHNLFQNENCRQFQREILSLKSMNEVFANPTSQIKDFISESKIKIDSKEFDLISICDHASRRELTLLFLQEGNFKSESIQELVTKIYTNLSLLSGYDKDYIIALIDQAFSFIRQYPNDSICLLSR